ncbi:MAG: fatty acid desaturase [Hasllibacter sp.]
MRKGHGPARHAVADGAAARGRQTEWPTLGLIVLVHAGWAGLLAAAGWIGGGAAAALLAPLLALHASLQHEVLHGHPFRSRRANEICAALPLALWLPYRRFRDTHLAHHHDPALTDPYEDPETNFVHPRDWARLPGAWRAVLVAQNTLLGRMALGPAVSAFRLWRDDARAIGRGDRAVIAAWALHLPAAAAVLAAVTRSGIGLPAYLAAIYASLSILKIRTFLEHRAHPLPRARSVIVEDRGPLAFLFLNNNLHALHHERPGVPWYELPALHRATRARTLARNGGYRYAGYGAVARAHLLRMKDPVTHPLRDGFAEEAPPLPGAAQARRPDGAGWA